MRSREQVIWDFVQQWLKKADSDLQTAEILLKAKMKDYFTCIFHCQQGIEKFIKAYLVRHQIDFRKTHDLDELLNLTSRIDPSFSQEINSCVWLTPYGVEFRYPGEYPEADHQTAEKAYKEAEKVKNVVMKKLREYLSKGRP